ncbi:MAG TPA: hypothetical protein VJ010_07685, partial [Actinomycetota bacterium]|nr:hypothetical protein [Actinomycetota bacterium]
MGARATRALHWARRHAVGLASIALALAVVGPLLTPGFVLAYDMVFVPSPHFSRQLLGISRLLPRAVPTELIVAAASHVLTGQVTQKLILFGILGGASLGAARLVPSSRPAARIGGGLLYAWNPMTFERLLLGQWVLLAGYAVLPWVASAALAFRRDEPGSGLRLTLWLGAAAALGPYCAIFAVPVAAAIALAPRWNRGGPIRKAGLLICAAVAVNLPWLGPALLHPASPGAATLGLQLFRARADSPVGTLGSLVSLGGVWRTDLAPPGRDTLGWVPAFALMAVLIVWGWRALGTRWPKGARAGLLALAGLGLALAVAPVVPGARDAASWLDRVLPGGGLIRDTQKFVVPLALAEAVGFGLGVDRLLEVITRSKLESRALVVVAALAAIAPIALAPTLAWGAGGRLRPSRYPPSWAAADRAM